MSINAKPLIPHRPRRGAIGHRHHVDGQQQLSIQLSAAGVGVNAADRPLRGVTSIAVGAAGIGGALNQRCGSTLGCRTLTSGLQNRAGLWAAGADRAS